MYLFSFTFNYFIYSNRFDILIKVFQYSNSYSHRTWFIRLKMGPNKLIERFKVMKIEQDPNQKDRVLLDIHITPYFPAKSFVIQLAGHKGDNPEDAIWESEYHQE